jgi:hypothetical protein
MARGLMRFLKVERQLWPLRIGKKVAKTTEFVRGLALFGRRSRGNPSEEQ